jgi:hypothetical protein
LTESNDSEIEAMSTARGLGIAVGLAIVLGFRSAQACGGGGVASRSGVVMNAQRIFMSTRAAGTTDMIVQIAVPATTADYAVLIPVPSEPTLDSQAVSSDDLDALDELTAPRILTDSSDDDDSGCGCGAVGAAGEPKGGVTASAPVQIGPVTAVSITGEDVSAVSDWLIENGFALSTDDTPTLTEYVGAGKYFIAIRRSNAAATGEPSSVGIHYSLVGHHRQLSLAFTRIGAAPRVAFTVFLVADRTMGPSAPFAALTLDDLDASLLRQGSYASAVGAAVASQASRAFVLESSTAASSLVSQVPGLAPFVDSGAIVTRATTVIERAALDRDALFMTPFAGALPRHRFAVLQLEDVRYASGGLLGLLLLRRRHRRR